MIKVHMHLVLNILKSTKRYLCTYFFQKNRDFLLKGNICLFARKYSERTMVEENFSGKNLKDIIKCLEAFAPLKYAESWDNVGLLVDPMEEIPIKQILLTNDLTEDVVEEAVKINAGLIITYHPNIFRPLKTVISNDWKQRIVINCIKNKIAVFSPHTSWDCVRGGVNDWLASAFSPTWTLPIKPNESNSDIGPGRMFALKNSITVQEAIAKVKELTGLPFLRLALAKNKNEKDVIKNVALCAGSGSSVLNGVPSDLYLTGEMLHHDILDATQKGIHVILCNHSDSERGFLKEFKNTLRSKILKNEVNVTLSICDKDPLKTL